MEENPAVFPFVGNGELSSVGADRIVAVRDVGRIRRERVWNIEVDRDSIAVHLPVGGDGYFAPAADIVFGPVKIDGSVGGFTDPVELPAAVERFAERRGFAVGLEGHSGIEVGDEGTVAGLFVYAYDLGIFPIGRRQSLGLLPDVRLGNTTLLLTAAGKSKRDYEYEQKQS